MEEAIRNFASQLNFKPEILGADNLQQKAKTVIVGMGGSHLGPDLVKLFRPEKEILVVSDYGIPAVPKSFHKDTLFVMSSHSGNTEEVIDAFHKVREKGLPMAAITTGGKLLRLAENHNVPHVVMPYTAGEQPRMALIYSLLGILKILGDEEGIAEVSGLAGIYDSSVYEEEGRQLAEKLKGKTPIIYSSTKNYIIAYNWKIKFNETGKIPAFYNLIPELHHNEMTGFDIADSTKSLSEKMAFVLIEDDTDHPRNKRRMEILKDLYEDRGLQVEVVALQGNTLLERTFRSLNTADWAVLHTAEMYGLEAEQVPMVEEFKDLLKK